MKLLCTSVLVYYYYYVSCTSAPIRISISLSKWLCSDFSPDYIFPAPFLFWGSRDSLMTSEASELIALSPDSLACNGSFTYYISFLIRTIGNLRAEFFPLR